MNFPIYKDSWSHELFEGIFKNYSRRLRYFAYKIVSDIEAEDIIAEVFIKLWEKKPEFISEDKLRIYLFTLTKNKSLHFLKKPSTRSEIRLPETFEIPDLYIQQLTIYSDILSQIYDLIETLPPKCKQIFKLLFIYDLTKEEVAKSLGIAINTVEAQRGLAINRLRLNFNVDASKIAKSWNDRKIDKIRQLKNSNVMKDDEIAKLFDTTTEYVNRINTRKKINNKERDLRLNKKKFKS